ncbi:uncharacterized protein BP5553_01175 [Venustampulla echinocandica]|uniref:Uncharacterized protein n=1 Tax=Venustampulla echinocandica TaxID=2656787 RepID=A0A370U095_9HELO|nr:uncharacterized protein BP5553_01175 [Venustampulla echinocandica]RDL41196.1 hypothetical protein BP5553_01175 [Venustampulla echinocandica]
MPVCHYGHDTSMIPAHSCLNASAAAAAAAVCSVDHEMLRTSFEWDVERSAFSANDNTKAALLYFAVQRRVRGIPRPQGIGQR